MEFQKYQHVERIRANDSNAEVKGLLNGDVYVQYKLDGTNTTVWLDDEGKVAVGKRSQMMGEGDDNAGSKAYVLSHPEFEAILRAHPTWRLCGEFMVRHTIKTYDANVWNKLYIFDVIDESEGIVDRQNYLKPEEYIPELEKFCIPYVPVYKVLNNPTYEQLTALIDLNETMFVTEGSEEGFVFKNYEYLNPYGRRTWGKLVRETFKEMAYGENYVKKDDIETIIVRNLLSKEFCEKEMAKVLEAHETDSFSPYFIPEILGRIQFEFVRDNITYILKEYKKPTINFKELFSQIAKYAKELLMLW